MSKSSYQGAHGKHVKQGHSAGNSVPLEQANLGDQSALDAQNTIGGEQNTRGGVNAQGVQNAFGEQNAFDEQNAFGAQNLQTNQNAQVPQNVQVPQNAQVNQNAQANQNVQSPLNTQTPQNQDPNTSFNSYVPYGFSDEKPKKKKGVLGVLVTIIVILIVLVLLAFGTKAVYKLFTSEKSKSGIEAGIEKEVTFPEDSLATDYSQILYDEDIIDNQSKFLSELMSSGADTSLKPGTYTLTTLMPMDDLIDALIDGPIFVGNVAIPEGSTVDEVAEAVAAATNMSKEDFLKQAYKASDFTEDYSFIEGAYDDSVEGFLAPKTYYIDKDATPYEAISEMLDQFVSETQNNGVSLDGANGYNIHEIVTIASIIEAETYNDDERPLVASVIYNRLDIDMPLQVDPSIVYSLGDDYSGEALTYDDLEVDSPYNTYQNTGLPPGPIDSPSIESIVAATQPEDTDYIYYLSIYNDGELSFYKDYDDFIDAKNKGKAASKSEN